MARCLRCGADNSWIEGNVPDEPALSYEDLDDIAEEILISLGFREGPDWRHNRALVRCRLKFGARVSAPNRAKDADA